MKGGKIVMKKMCLFGLILTGLLFISGPALAEEETEGVKEKTTVFNLGEIVVSEDRIADIEQATTTTVVTAEDIEARSDRDLSDTLQMVPGISTYQHGKGHIRFKMRGFEMPYVALLIDGIPISDVYEANVDISKIFVMNASEIVVNRGTSSALYGSNGTVGSINIVTKKPTGLYAKGSAEYGNNGDYTLNAAQGNTIDDFYYWVTANIARQDEYEPSDDLSKSERRRWFDKFFTDGLGYNINDTNYAAEKYLDHTGNWPHQEMFKYNLAAKTGYNFTDDLEAGVTVNFTQSQAKRYCVTLTNTEETRDNEWPSSDPTLSLGANAFDWDDIRSITVAPYANYKNGDFNIRGNVFYIYTDEILDGYADAEELTPVRGWGGTHSNWTNSTWGYNVFPSYKIADWNKLNGSVLYREDKHIEREAADDQFVGTGLGNADAAYAFAGTDYFMTKHMEMKQITIGLEDEIDLDAAMDVPVNISAGISYDAQKFTQYDKRDTWFQGGRVREYYDMEGQYILDEDSSIWGTRDSFNPVIGATYEPMKDFMLVRGSFSKKTKLPTLSQYANVDSELADEGLDPEKSYNTNVGVEFFFLNKILSIRTDLFYTKFEDKLYSVYSEDLGDNLYTNTDGEIHKGIEFITSGHFKDVIDDIMDMQFSFTYVYLNVENLDDSANSDLNKGDRIEDVPEHQVVADIRMDFVTDTSVNIFGEYTANAIRYAMKANPDSTDAFSTDYYKEVELNDPLIFNVKVSQKFWERYEAYVLCRNIFDDYDADPFNPGPGRQYFIGISAEL